MINSMKSALLVAGAALISFAAPASAQVAAGQTVAAVDLEGARAQSAAFKAAEAQIQASFKPQIDAFVARQNVLGNELAPLRKEIETLQANPATPRATVEAKIALFQSKAQAAQAELQRLATPFARPEAYVKEQIGEKLEAALKAAMTAKKINLVITPEAVVAMQGGADLTPDVVTQLNALIPSASITPPAGWQPGQPKTAPAKPAGR